MGALGGRDFSREWRTGAESSRVRKSAAWSDWSFTVLASRTLRKVLAKVTSAVMLTVVVQLDEKERVRT